MSSLYNILQLNKKVSKNKDIGIVPKEGWIKTIRMTIGMTRTQLAKRLGVTAGRVVAIEKAEEERKLKLETLEKVAEALNCELRYVFVPKREQSFSDQANNAAYRQAKKIVMASNKHMALEDQSAKNEIDEQIELLAQELLHKNNLKGLWNE